MFKPALHKPHLSLQNTLSGVESQSAYSIHGMPVYTEGSPVSPSKRDLEKQL